MNPNNLSAYLNGQVAGLTDEQVAQAQFATPVSGSDASAPAGQTVTEDPSDDELWNTMDPETGARFIIPFLPISDPLYKSTYIQLMLTRHRDPGKFNRMVLMRDK